MKTVIFSLLVSGIAAIALVGCDDSSSSDAKISSKAELGERLYEDKNLSFDRTQSCATCHNPDKGFIDDRLNDASRDSGHGLIAAAGSLGDNQTSIGDRNAPTAAYAAFSPEFKHGSRQRAESQKTAGIADYLGFQGGQFWDGREADLKGQAGGPPTNPGEMAMPDKASVVERLKENDEYITAFESLYDNAIFDDVDLAYAAMAESIAEFEKTAEFFPFDSKYDRSLAGEYEFSPSAKASLGKARFFSSDLTCAACHQLHPLGDSGEIFTSFEYHNIGVPVNTSLRTLNGTTSLDEGLLNNPNVSDITEQGKFKVPTLRNVAVTAPYMHNGIFNELTTVLRFYQHAKDRALNVPLGGGANINPETQLPWGPAEIGDNIAHDLLGASDINLNDTEIEAIECFLLSLTDARYEPLLDAEKVANCGL